MIVAKLLAATIIQPKQDGDFSPNDTSFSNLLFVAVAMVLLTRSSLDLISEANKFSIGSADIGIGAPINALMIGVSFLLILANYKILPLRDFVAWFAFLALCIFGSVETTQPINVARSVLALLSSLCVFIIPFCLIKGTRDVRRLIDLILLSSLIPTCVGLLQIIANLGDGDFRLQSTFSHPNIFAFYIVVVMAALMFKWSSVHFTPNHFRRFAYIFYFGVLGVLLIYTKTRTAWFGAGVLFTVFALFIDRRAIPLLFVIPFLALLEPGVRDRLLDVASETEYIGDGVIINSLEWRKVLWRSAFVWIEERPFFGHGGLNSFLQYSPRFFSLEERGVPAHSVYVRLLFEIGILGLIFFVGIFVQALWRLSQMARSDWNGVVIGITLCVSYLAFCFADNMLYYGPFNWYFLFFLGIVLAAGRVPVRRGAGLLRPRWQQQVPIPSPAYGRRRRVWAPSFLHSNEQLR